MVLGINYYEIPQVLRLPNIRVRSYLPQRSFIDGPPNVKYVSTRRLPTLHKDRVRINWRPDDDNK